MALSCNNKAKGHWNVTFANTHITSSRCRVSQFARLFLRLSRPLLFLPSLNTYLYRQIHSVIIENFLFSIFFFVLFLIYNNLVPIVIKKRRKGKKAMVMAMDRIAFTSSPFAYQRSSHPHGYRSSRVFMSSTIRPASTWVFSLHFQSLHLYFSSISHDQHWI